MSSRVFRKLQGNSQLHIPGEKDEEEEDDFNIVSVKGKKKNRAVNPFDLLNEGGDKSSDDEKGNECDDVVEGNEIKEKDEPMNTKNSGNKKRKKKKKKCNKKELDVSKNEEDIDETIREVNEMLGITITTSSAISDNSTSSANSVSVLDSKALLCIENRNLNADNEMKKRFGSNIVRTENSRQRRAHRRVYQRSTWLVSPKDTWPPTSKSGLSMTLEKTVQGYNYFIFEHSHAYQQIQFLFLNAVESLDANNISALLHSHPYHIDSLLQLSEICKMGEDFQMAAELVERALYCCECSFHTLFSLSQGTCRLDYKRAENRSFFIALFRHLTFVGQKGCHRTALELCKLLLSLDPDNDPLCALLMIDFYALTSDQNSYLVRLYDEWQNHRNLSQLPNFAFSVPLALFHMNKNSGDLTRANQMLQDALLMFPSLLVPLLDKCSVALDSTLSNHKFFHDARISASIALNQLVMLYIGRAHHVWKDAQVIDWLVTNIKATLERVDNNDPYVEDCNKKRAVRYRGTPRAIYRHIIMSDIKDATASLPMDLQDTPLMSYDPLPPQDSVSGYSRPERQRGHGEEHSPLSLFFRSLLPSFNPQAPNNHDEYQHVERQVAQEVEGAEGGPQPIRGSDIAQSVESLMTAMRQLLTSISFQGVPENDGPPQEEQEWDENEDNRQ